MSSKRKREALPCAVRRVVYSKNAGMGRPVVCKVDAAPLLRSYLDEHDELESDNDEGDVNRIGNVPLKWYDEFEHIGYGIDQQKRVKADFKDSAIGEYLKGLDDPDHWRTIKDFKNLTQYRLTDEDLMVIHKLRQGQFLTSIGDEDRYVEFDNSEHRVHPLRSPYPPKRQFTPSLHEKKRIERLIKLIRAGVIQLEKKEPQREDFQDIWKDNILVHGAASAAGDLLKSASQLKTKLPLHSESYNPPTQCLYTPEEEKRWREARKDERVLEYLPAKYSSIRRIPLYDQLLVERFQHCLDLYLCPRTIRMRMNVDPQSLLPKLPSPEELCTFPSNLSITYAPDHEESTPLCMSFDATGEYFAVGRKNGLLDVFETLTSRFCYSYNFGQKSQLKPFPVQALQFNPTYPILGFSCGPYLYMVVLKKCMAAFIDEDNTAASTNSLAKASELLHQSKAALQTNTAAPKGWTYIEENDWEGWRIQHAAAISQLAWHRKGLYLSCVASDAVSPSDQLILFALKLCKTLRPIGSNTSGKIQAAQFHPVKNHVYVGTTKAVKLYDLAKTPDASKGKNLIHTFSGVDQVNCMSVDCSGELVLTGGLNRRLTWFERDFGEKPLKILRCHSDTVSCVQFHSSRPLAASASLSGEVHLFYAKVPAYESQGSLASPMIVPLKKLSPINELCPANTLNLRGVASLAWHPTQPWIAIGSRTGHVGLFVPA